MIEDNPCRFCTERFTACHDNCPKDARGEFGHKAWKERYHAQQKHLKDNKYRMLTPMTHARERRNDLNVKHPLHKRGGDQ